MEKGKLPIKERRALRVKSVEMAVEMALRAGKYSLDPAGADDISDISEILYTILEEKSAKEVYQPEEKTEYGRR